MLTRSRQPVRLVRLSRHYATAPAPTAAPKRSLLRRTVVPVVLGGALFYGVSVPLAHSYPRYRDFLVETVPFGEAIGTWLDDYELDSLMGKGKGNAAKQAEKKEPKGSNPKSYQIDKVTTVKTNPPASSISSAPSPADVALAAKTKAEQAATAVKDAAKSAAAKIEAAAKPPVAPAAAAAPAVEVAKAEPAPTVPLFAQRPRDVSASGPVEPRKGAPSQPYQGPPLSIGFEPPSGYAVAREAPAKDSKGSIKPPEVKLPPLPLVAPTVKEAAGQEPLLGQLASTIDGLAAYAGKAVTEGQTSILVSGVLGSAKEELAQLSERIAKIKEAEKKRLESELDKQAKDYSAQLLKADKEALDRIDKTEADWRALFEKERESLFTAYKSKLDTELTTQQELIESRLKENVIAQGVEMQRRWADEVKAKVETERGGRLSKLKELEQGVRQLEEIARANEGEADRANKAWKVAAALKAVEHQVAQGGPFNTQLVALKGLLTPKDGKVDENLVVAALSTVPDAVSGEGIASFPTLAARFTLRVAPAIKRASLLPENASFLAYVQSVAWSGLLARKQGWSEGEDVVSVLGRAEFLLAEKDLDGAAREVNSLKGWPKRLARDWLEAARRHLEVKQALEVAEIEATAASLKAL